MIAELRCSRGESRSRTTCACSTDRKRKLWAGDSVNESLRIDKSGRSYVSAYAIALVYEALGDKEQALRWLDKAVEERSAGLPRDSD